MTMSRKALVLAALAACAGPTRYDTRSVPQVTDDAASAFGAGIESARPGSIVLDLSAPAYVAVARFGAIEVGERVYPLDGPAWLEFGYPAWGAPVEPLAPGKHRLDIPLPWLRVDVIPAARRAAPGDRCRYKDNAWACTTWSNWRFQQNDHTAVYYSDLPAPDSLAEHHFVVIASKEPIDLAELDQRLDDLHDVRISAVAAARSASHYLMAKHEGTWTAYAMTVRIQGVR